MSPHLIWEIIKYEIRKFCIKFSKAKSKIKRVNKLKHETVVQNFESNPECQNASIAQYNDSKFWLENLYDEQLRGIILRSKSDWYEKGEKSTKYFLYLEKRIVSRILFENFLLRMNKTKQ